MALQLALLGFFTSALGCFLLVRYPHLHARYTMDPTSGGPQKMHSKAVPRVGGVPIVLAWVLCAMWMVVRQAPDATFVWVAMLALIPAFLGGIAEDVTKKVGPLARLLATFVSVTIAFFVLDARITRLEIPLVDTLLQVTAVSLAVTLVCAGGIAHAVNIIDGFNGLAVTVAVFVLAALGYVSYEVGDTQLMSLCIVCVAGCIGFWVWNYPFGHIFLGDAGAYSLGFMIATISVLLVARHAEVSAWFPLLLVAYPVWETLFSIYRRKRAKRKATDPDDQHLHTLAYKRIVLWMNGTTAEKPMAKYNAMTSPLMWLLSLSTIVPALLFWRQQSALLVAAAVFIVVYCMLYSALNRTHLAQVAQIPHADAKTNVKGNTQSAQPQD
jgi:UDP-GlcNAc:undecaprenyl-phosphate/decaprenyl-phosphate GlcNAc-1-phosphate transferase